MTTALYVHVPFCWKICPYCDFYKKEWRQVDESRYLDALEIELNAYLDQFPDLHFATLYLGGGSPGGLSEEGLHRLLSILTKPNRFIPNAEKTIEMNPESVVSKKLTILTQFGINRVSLGAQSFDDNELQFLGRIHDANRTKDAVHLLQHHQLTNINLDLIYSLPNSTINSVAASLDNLLSLNPFHISTYSLTIESGTPFADRNIRPQASEGELAQYKHIQKTLRKAGFEHYEVSAFARSGYQSQHNHAYWNFSSFIGLGPSAHSYFNGLRYSQPRNLDEYCTNPARPLGNIPKPPRHPTLHDLPDFLLTSLRVRKGISISAANTQFNRDIPKLLESGLIPLQKEGLMSKSRTHLKVTKKGLYVLDSVIEALIESVSVTD